MKIEDMASLDVKPLYTNISVDKCLIFLKTTQQNQKYTSPYQSTKS